MQRERRIVLVLARHGLGWVVDVFGLGWLVPFHRGILGHARREAPYTGPEHLRMALEELGPTAIKFGQVLSSRPDILPPAYVQELEKLWDRVPPVPGSEVRARIEAELGRPIDELFARFDDAPLAAASIGQVHSALLPDGTEVVVKVRKTGVLDTVEDDLAILRRLARAAERRSALARQYEAVAVVEEFAWTIRAEMDYMREGRNAERLRRTYRPMPAVRVPVIYWSHTSRGVLTMERLYGIRINELAELDAAGVDRRRVARLGARMLMHSVLREGFFHADPHPGNFLVQTDGSICLLDYGMTGSVDPRLRFQMVRVGSALVRRDIVGVVDGIADVGMIRQERSLEPLQRELEHLLDRYYGMTLRDVDPAVVVHDMFGVVRRQSLRLPPSLALLAKTLVMQEGLWRQLDPEFNAAGVMEPYVRALAREMRSPGRWAREAAHAAQEAAILSLDLPTWARRTLRRLDRGDLELSLRHGELHEALGRLERMVTRLSASIVFAALLVGVALLLAAIRFPGWNYLVGAMIALGTLGMAAMATWSAWLLLRTPPE